VNKLAIIKEFWDFMRVRKKWWLAPIVVFLMVLGGLLIFAKSSALAPLIYSLF
jgi:flagellar biosynthesis/type III secretory pathway M-ring protein FliF/YscJ